MRHTRTIILCLTALLFVFAAEARRPKSKRVTNTDPWPEEIPDYAPASDTLMVQPLPTVNYSELSDDNLLELLLSEPIMGNSRMTAKELHRFVIRYNPDFDLKIAQAYIKVGERYGIRGDIALCQSILETGWFRFADGTMVTPDQHNYCGLGVVGRGHRGNSFDTIEDGVTAQIQHLYAYACNAPIPAGEKLLDPRFKLVARGIAPTWSDLSGRWAANDRYARSIMKLYIELERFSSLQATK